MSVCEYCHRDTIVIQTCLKCGGKFCIEHRLPKSHDCPSLATDQAPSYIVYRTKPGTFDGNETGNTLESVEAKHDAESIDTIDDETIDQEDLEERDSKVTSSFYIVLGVLLVASLVVNGYLYLNYLNYIDLYDSYLQLYNSSIELPSYYINLTAQYSELRSEYTQLNELYLDLLKNNSNLKKEYEAILGYNESLELVTRKTITLLPKQNYTEIYEVPFSGYIIVNYTASGDAYTWIGSTSIENGYYSRNPQFPQTATSINFTVPVLPDVTIYFANPDEFEAIELTFSVVFIY